MTDVQEAAERATRRRIDADVLKASRQDVVADIATLEAMYGTPKRTSIDKVTPALTPLMIEFLNASPMYFLA